MRGARVEGRMHATIRRYEAGALLPGDPLRAWRAVAARLGQEPGFVSCAVLASVSGGYAAISFFDDAASLEAADHLTEGLVKSHVGALAGPPSELITGEVVAQRGL